MIALPKAAAPRTVAACTTAALVLLLALLATLLGAKAPAAYAFPAESHCGTETGGPPYDGFMSHEQVGHHLQQIAHSSRGRVQVEVGGVTTQGREIWVAKVGHGPQVMLVQSEIHGNEKHGTRALLSIVRTLGNNSARSKKIRSEITFVAIPLLNADGGAIPRRTNVMSWADVMALHPQLPAAPRAWYHSLAGGGGFDVNRDFNANLDYEPQAGDLPGTGTQFGFWLTPEARTVREVYRELENEYGLVDVFVDLHNQAPCYGHGLPNLVEIDEPSSAAGTYEAHGASFGVEPTVAGVSGDIVLVNDGTANPTLGCSPLQGFPSGAVALIDRGVCTFVQKVTNAQAAGASAVIIANNVATAPTLLTGTAPGITIPSVHVSQEDGAKIKAGLPASGRVADRPESAFYTPLSISGRFLTDPTAHGNWPRFDDDASRRANVAVYDALQGQGNSPFGKVTRYPQPPSTNIPGTALASFALRGSAVVLFETSGQTQQIGLKRHGMLSRQVEVGVGGLVDALADGTFDDIDPDRYGDIPLRVASPL
jgi:predicted deacylase